MSFSAQSVESSMQPLRERTERPHLYEIERAFQRASAANDEETTCCIIDNHDWLPWDSDELSNTFEDVCLTGMKEAASKMIHKGVKIKPQHFDATVVSRQRDVSQLLLDSGYAIADSPSILATCKGDHDWLEWLVSVGSDPNSYSMSTSPKPHAMCALDSAAGFGTIKDIQDLLELGADLQKSDALIWAVRRRHGGDEESIEMAKWLLSKGARIGKIFHDHLDAWAQYDRDAGTAWHEAVCRRKSDAVKQILLDAGADTEAVSREGLTTAEWVDNGYCWQKRSQTTV